MKPAKMSKMMEASISYSQRAPKSVCTCGHHGDGNASWHDGSGPARGHGSCFHPGCSCQKFTWKNWTPAYAEFRAKTQF
jgi:hypothetical protein